MRVLNLGIHLLRKMKSQQLLTVGNILLGLWLVTIEKSGQSVMGETKNTLLVVKSIAFLISSLTLRDVANLNVKMEGK